MDRCYASQPSYGYIADQPVAQQCYTPAYDYAATQQAPLYYSYNDTEYTPYQPHVVDCYHSPYVEPPPDTTVPLWNYSTLLSPSAGDPLRSTDHYRASYDAPTPFDECNPLDVHVAAAQLLSATPSDLLADLNIPDRGRSSHAQSAPKTPSNDHTSPGLRKRKRESVEKHDNFNQRKAYFRSLSDNVGFTITDPDTITSHDKKRSYLECLEEYVQWLHQQIHLLGSKPLPLERISTYRGLKNRSLRTILVHKEDALHKLNIQKMQTEQKFMELQNTVLVRQTTQESLQLAAHSSATDAMPKRRGHLRTVHRDCEARKSTIDEVLPSQPPVSGVPYIRLCSHSPLLLSIPSVPELPKSTA